MGRKGFLKMKSGQWGQAARGSGLDGSFLPLRPWGLLIAQTRGQDGSPLRPAGSGWAAGAGAARGLSPAVSQGRRGELRLGDTGQPCHPSSHGPEGPGATRPPSVLRGKGFLCLWLRGRPAHRPSAGTQGFSQATSLCPAASPGDRTTPAVWAQLPLTCLCCWAAPPPRGKTLCRPSHIKSIDRFVEQSVEILSEHFICPTSVPSAA